MVKDDLSAGKTQPKIIAHRGASAVAPENTLAAFREAIAAGADGIEFDVRITKDNEAVVFHDRKLKRTTGRKGTVADLTSAEIVKLDAGSWFAGSNGTTPFANEVVSTLKQALDFLADFDGTIYIELKCKEADVERLTRRVAEILNQTKRIDRVIVKSFKLAVIPLIKQHCPGIRTAALFAPKVKNVLRKEKYLVKIAEELGADEISLHFTLATKKLMKKARSRGLTVAIWTADNPRWIKRAIRLGLNSIITNDPKTLLARRAALAA
jgi:Glycerophosphoryl diester phosphodiesterase